MSGVTWTKFYWSDWESDEALKLCSPGAQALWMRMLCICAKSDGYLVIAGKALDVEDMARSTGWPLADVRKWWAELKRWKVFSTTGRGKVYCRRMEKEARRSEIARENGSKGGNPSLTKQTENPNRVNQKSNPRPTKTPGTRARLNHLPDTREKEPNGSSLSPGEPARAKPKGKSIPIGDWSPDTEEVAQAVERVRAAGVALDVAEHARRFRSHALTHDRRVVDWGAAWIGWIEIEIGKAPKAEPAEPEAKPFVWPGPTEVWDLACSAKGGGANGRAWAQSYIGPCGWRDGTLICPSPTLSKGIRAEIGKRLDELGYRLSQGAAA